MTLARAFRQESPFWPFLAALVVQLAAFGVEMPDYHPLGDDIALIVHATDHVAPPHFLDWVTRGLAGCFTVYPEWTSPFSNFLRPLVELTYYLEHLLFQDVWGLYLVLGFLVNAIAAAEVYVVAHLFLQCRRVTSYLVTLVFFVTVLPAKAVFYPSFAFEPLAAVLATGAFLAMAQSRRILATLLITAALFTKETAVVGAVALGASALVLAWTHRPPGSSLAPAVRNAAAMTLLPIAAWVSARIACCGGFGGTYVTRHLDTVSGVLRKVLLGASVWPLGHDLEPVAATLTRLAAVLGGTGRLGPEDPSIIAFLVVNFLFAVFFVHALIQAVVHHQGEALSPRAWAAFCWVVSMGGLLVGLGLEKRFGYLGYMFGMPVLGRLIETAHRRPLRLASMAYLMVQCLIGTGALIGILSAPARAERRAAYARARDLVQLLETVSLMEDRQRTVYLVNDVVGDHAGPQLRRFATKDPNADLVVLTSRTDVTPRFTRRSGTVEISLAGNRPLVFPGVDAARMLPLSSRDGTGLTIRRNDTLSYTFPQGTTRPSRLGDTPRIDFGNTVTITVKDPRGIFVYYDAPEHQHRLELPWTH